MVSKLIIHTDIKTIISVINYTFNQGGQNGYVTIPSPLKDHCLKCSHHPQHPLSFIISPITFEIYFTLQLHQHHHPLHDQIHFQTSGIPTYAYNHHQVMMHIRTRSMHMYFFDVHKSGYSIDLNIVLIYMIMDLHPYGCNINKLAHYFP